MRRVACLVLVAASLTLSAGCPRRRPPAADPTPPAAQGARADAAGAPAPAREPWADRPPAEWPQIVLTNRADFRGHTGLHGASAFLVRDRDGTVLAATARHLLGEDGGVRPAVAVADLEQALVSWKMSPRTLEADFVIVEKPRSARHDVVLLHVKPGPRALPARPLQVRPEQARAGERVYLVGCPYAESRCKQNVYPGKVLEHGEGPGFQFSLDRPVAIPGFSGAPIVDEAGRAVGVLQGGDGQTATGQDLLPAFNEDDPGSAVVLTDRAVEQVKRLLGEASAPAGTTLRIALRNGDPTRHTLDLDPSPEKDDWRGEVRGVTVTIPRRDLPHLRGAVVDYVPDRKAFAVTSADPYPLR
jgi:Fe-S cluster assembly iron-binding protein IscA